MIFDAGTVLALSMFAVACVALMAGYPVAFTLAGVAIIFAAVALGLEYFLDVPIPLDVGYLTALSDRMFGLTLNTTLLAVPLFVAMGVALERSRVAEDLLENMALLFGKMRGGLGVSVIVVGALLAASTGIVGATVVTMGLLSLPTMMKQGYDRRLAAGSIAAAGTLGQIIPPSIVLVLLGDVLSSAYQEAQQRLGQVARDPLSVGDLFAGALLPGLMLVGIYIAYQLFIAWIRPESAPAMSNADDGHINRAKLLSALLPPIILLVAVLGSILAGIATPTEAAGVGAVGAMMLGALRLSPNKTRSIWFAGGALALLLILANVTDLRLAASDTSLGRQIAIGAAFILTGVLFWGVLVAIMRLHRAEVLHPILMSTVRISVMVYTILIGAAVFSLVFRGLGGDTAVHHLLTQLPGGQFGAMLVVMLLIFFLGFFLDFIEITFVVVPIVAPVLMVMGLDPIWIGVMIAINLQTSFLTPPFGFALFYLRGVAPSTISTGDIYRGAIPFVLLQIGALILLSLWPQLATWLPRVVFG
ncbi:MAG: TRAP transporter large permease subunit [Sphingomonadales bacterium]|jgi:tripartite ATP-independent transporter DctM subunit